MTEFSPEEERKIRFLHRRFGHLKEDQKPDEEFEEVDGTGGVQPFVLGKKPSAVKTVTDFARSQRKKRPPPTKDEVDERQFGMGTLGQLTMREFDLESLRVPYIRRQLSNFTDHRPYFTYWVTSGSWLNK